MDLFAKIVDLLLKLWTFFPRGRFFRTPRTPPGYGPVFSYVYYYSNSTMNNLASIKLIACKNAMKVKTHDTVSCSQVQQLVQVYYTASYTGTKKMPYSCIIRLPAWYNLVYQQKLIILLWKLPQYIKPIIYEKTAGSSKKQQ